MTPGSEIVPARPKVASRPQARWRAQIEDATRLVVGMGAAVLGGNGRVDSPVNTAADVALGFLIGSERLALDSAERVVETGAAVVRFGARFPPARELARRTLQQIEPVRRRGMVARTRVRDSAHATLPRYAEQAVNAALDLVSLDDILDAVDVDRIIERVDIQRIVDRADIESIVDRADIQSIVDRADIQSIVDRVDLNDLMTRIDLDALVGRTDLGSIIAQSTGGVASGAIDLVRRQGVGLDGFVSRWAGRLRPRGLRDAPLGPRLLVDPKSAKVDTEADS